MTEIDPRSNAQIRVQAVLRWLAAPVDIAALAAFRILFGLLMAAAMVRFMARDWVNQLYVLPRFHFPYDGFGWVQPLPAAWLHLHFVVLTVLALMVAAGCCYRVAIVLFALGFTYVELLDQTAYLNHYYLISLLSGLLIFLPAHRAWSLDVWRQPALRLDTVPAWTLHLLRFQVALVYLFAGLAKVNADWLLHAQPLRIWLSARSDLPVLGQWLQPLWVAYAASWFGAIYDLSIVFFLLHPRTRKVAFIAVIGFHVGTWALFNIGMFPWIMLVASTLFFRPDWARIQLERRVEQGSRWFRRPAWRARVKAMVGPTTTAGQGAMRHPQFVVTCLALYAVVQLLLPLRPYLFGQGHPAWSYRGFNLAWQVMVAEKTGSVEFYAREPGTDQRVKIDTRPYLTPRQERLMAQDPWLIQALARRIRADLQAQGRIQPEIIVDAYATLNGRPSQRLIDPEVDISKSSLPPWIVPLAE